MQLFRIKWERIILIFLVISMIISWVAFIYDSNVYTLAIATLETFIEISFIFAYDTIKTFREDVIKNWK